MAILYVGDSLAVGTGPQVKAQMPYRTIDLDAEVGRPSWVGATRVEGLFRAGRHHIVVFDIGTNDPNSTSLRESVVRVRSRIGPMRHLILCTLNGPYDTAGKNEFLRRYAEARTTVHLVQTTRIPAGPDGMHYTPSGYVERAKLVARAIRRR